MIAPSQCPPNEQLIQFASGSLTDDQSASLEEHVDSCPNCRATLSNLARGEVPTQLGRYRVDTVLGSGGMAIVYRAWDPQLARPVAIKVVKRAASDEIDRARLVREAQSLARLSHPNVCHVYDVGSEGDEVWVAMELIDGATLRAWAAEGRSADELLDVLLGAAEGIAAAHEAGLMHRDVKPENVLVTKTGRAIVMDFGLARPDETVDPKGSTAAGAGDPQLTATGAIAGTPAYLAPEQLTGDPVDARVDQFAWAVMTWELLVGQRPFPVLFAVRVEAVRAGVTPPPALDRTIAAVLMRAMSAVPADRYGLMRDVIAAIRARPQLAGASAPAVAAEAPVAPAPAPVRAAGSRGVVYAGAAVAVAGALAFTASQWPRGSEPRAQPPLLEQALAAELPAPPPPAALPPDAAVVPELQHVAPPVQPTHPPSKPAPAITNTAPPAPPSEDERYRRSVEYAKLVMFCQVPYDFASPEKLLRGGGTVDWGKVTSIDDYPVRDTEDDPPYSLRLVTIAGQRGNVTIRNELLRGQLHVKVGDLLAYCLDREVERFKLARGSFWTTQAALTISSPPRVAAIARYTPIYISPLKFVADADMHRFTIDTSRRYLVYAKINQQAGTRWEMDRWFLEVPAGVPGANLMAPGKTLWIVVENLAMDDKPGGGKQVVARAAAIVDELFPK